MNCMNFLQVLYGGGGFNPYPTNVKNMVSS